MDDHLTAILETCPPWRFCLQVVDKEDTNLEIYFDECIDFIDEAKKQGGSVLVHCFVGKSRSVTVVVAYLMKKQGMTLTQALQHVQSIRPVANPNTGFIRQLQDLEKSLQELVGRKAKWCGGTRPVHLNLLLLAPSSLSLKQGSKNHLPTVKFEDPTKIIPFGGNL
ncbi:hypothetical protein F2Q69_00037220 [Brassica cretica]|uniref:protein-tyrosine-phosphatase n=1 Tax=Brassica cretica TaxID=69181 RepID=A0A8S9SSB5_BRACR|nr:hypothetical protein F2Q69_00037220 [Brassica cretica]